MLIDTILDRRAAYNDGFADSDIYGYEQFRDMYEYATFFGLDYLASAIDGGTEDDIRRALCRYIDEGYNPSIKDFIGKVNWVVEMPDKKR